MVRRAWAAAAVALVASLGAAPAAPAASATPARCFAVTVAPTFAADGKVACAGWDGVWLSTDRGRSWQRRASTGLAPMASSSGISGVLFSPRYGADRTLYVFADKLLASTDDGETFVPVDGDFAWGGLLQLAPFVSTAPLAAGLAPVERVSFAYPGLYGYTAPSPSVIEPDLHLRRPVTGSGTITMRFVTPPRMGPNDNAFSFTLHADGLGVDRCDATFTCGEPLATFRGDDFLLSLPRAWVSADWPRHRRVHAVWMTKNGVRAFRSLDGGNTFVPWRSVDRLVRRAKGASDAPQVTFAHTAQAPGRLYAAVQQDTGFAPPRGTLVSELYRSDDFGDTWRLVAAGRQGAPRGAGRLPGAFSGYHGYEQGLVPAPDGRLFAAIDQDGVNAIVHCSTDGGRTWAPLCAR